MKKSNHFLFIVSLFCILILGCSTIAMSAQQVKVPYVVSTDSWWTGIAITNDSDQPIEKMTLYYTTQAGMQGSWMLPFRLVTVDPIDPINPIHKIWVPYTKELPTIDGHAMLLGTVGALYTGDGTKLLPSGPGSVILKNEGDQKFSVTVYVGSGEGFAFQTFKSTAP